MKITLLSEQRLRVEDTAGALTIEAESAETVYSPFHMIASGLAVCTFSVLQSWASHAKLIADGLAIDVAWSFVDEPHRAGAYDVRITWPGLPETRRQAAVRAAALCAVKNTLTHAPVIDTQVVAA